MSFRALHLHHGTHIHILGLAHVFDPRRVPIRGRHMHRRCDILQMQRVQRRDLVEAIVRMNRERGQGGRCNVMFKSPIDCGSASCLPDPYLLCTRDQYSQAQCAPEVEDGVE